MLYCVPLSLSGKLSIVKDFKRLDMLLWRWQYYPIAIFSKAAISSWKVGAGVLETL